MTKSTIALRKFNQHGMDAYTTIVNTKPSDIFKQISDLIIDHACTDVVHINGQVFNLEIKPIVGRLEFAEHMWGYFGHEKPLSHLAGDAHVWNWIAAVWMQPLVEASGQTDVIKALGKQMERWVLTSDTTRYHRHLVSSPFFAYESNFEAPEHAMCLLATPVLEPGEVVERISGKRSLSIGAVCHLATLLYYDNRTAELRKGHTSPPGNPKSFSYYFSQVDLNVDYEGMDVDALLNMLPEKFERWVKLAKAERLTKAE
jgi:hypothetical protein